MRGKNAIPQLSGSWVAHISKPRLKAPKTDTSSKKRFRRQWWMTATSSRISPGLRTLASHARCDLGASGTWILLCAAESIELFAGIDWLPVLMDRVTA
jgi:hypothetical protein